MLTIEKIKKESDTGNTVELECIDIKAISTSNKSYAETLLSKPLIFSHIFANKIIFKNKLFIYEAELQYFRIKRPTPTFDDLIDIATQAVRDKILISLEFTNSSIHYISKDRLPEKNRHGLSCRGKYLGILGLSPNMQIHYIKKEIDLINSLYTETFVIEHASDMERIKRTATIALENDCEVCAESDCLHHGVNYIQTTYGGMNFNLSFVSLKGATVTQKRGVA